MKIFLRYCNLFKKTISIVILLFIFGCSGFLHFIAGLPKTEVGHKNVSYTPLFKEKFSSRKEMAEFSSEDDIILQKKGYSLIGNNLKIDYIIESCRIYYKSYTGALAPHGSDCQNVKQSNIDNSDILKEGAKKGADLITDFKINKYMKQIIVNECIEPDTRSYPPRWATKCMDKDGGYDTYLSLTAGKLWRKEKQLKK